MKITLRKVGKTPLNFEKTVENITIKGYLQYDDNKLILLDAMLSGAIETECAVCGDEYELDVEEKLKFYVSDGIYKDENNALIDVVETKGGELDIEELLHSEIEILKSDYNCCEFCEIGED